MGKWEGFTGNPLQGYYNNQEMGTRIAVFKDHKAIVEASPLANNKGMREEAQPHQMFRVQEGYEREFFWQDIFPLPASLLFSGADPHRSQDNLTVRCPSKDSDDEAEGEGRAA